MHGAFRLSRRDDTSPAARADFDGRRKLAPHLRPSVATDFEPRGGDNQSSAGLRVAPALLRTGAPEQEPWQGPIGHEPRRDYRTSRVARTPVRRLHARP